MPVLSGGFFDAGGGPLCDMDADAERGVVSMMTSTSCALFACLIGCDAVGRRFGFCMAV